jgi:hypothetical protein
LAAAQAQQRQPLDDQPPLSTYDNTLAVASAATSDMLLTLRYRNCLMALDALSTPAGDLMATGSEAGDINVMRFFIDVRCIESYATLILLDLSKATPAGQH